MGFSHLMCNASLILFWNFEAAESKIVKHSVAESGQVLDDCRCLQTCEDSFDKRCSLLKHYAFFVIFFKTIYNKTIIRFGFCDIWNNQGTVSISVISLSLCLRLKTFTSTLNIPDIKKTSSNNFLHNSS